MPRPPNASSSKRCTPLLVRLLKLVQSRSRGPSRLDRLTPPHQLLTSFMSRRMRPLPKLWSSSKPPRRYQPALRRARAQSFLVHGEVTDHESRDTMESLVSRFCPHTGAAACFACLARARHPGPQLRSCRPWRRDPHSTVCTGTTPYLPASRPFLSAPPSPSGPRSTTTHPANR